MYVAVYRRLDNPYRGYGKFATVATELLERKDSITGEKLSDELSKRFGIEYSIRKAGDLLRQLNRKGFVIRETVVVKSQLEQIAAEKVLPIRKVRNIKGWLTYYGVLSSNRKGREAYQGTNLDILRHAIDLVQSGKSFFEAADECSKYYPDNSSKISYFNSQRQKYLERQRCRDANKKTA